MAGGRKLVTTVWIDGQAYGPDSDVPADVAERITNPKAWGDEPDPADVKSLDIKLAEPSPTPADERMAKAAQDAAKAAADAGVTAEAEVKQPAKKTPAAKK